MSFSSSPQNEPTPEAAAFTTQLQGNTLAITLTGEWAVSSLCGVEEALNTKALGHTGPVKVLLDNITRLDTAGALCLNILAHAKKQQGHPLELLTQHQNYQELLVASQPVEEETKDNKPASRFPALENLGKLVSSTLWVFGHQLAFFGHFCTTFVHLVANPRRMRFTPLVFHMEQTGLRTVPIVALLTFLIGMVVAYMGAEELARFGAQVFAVNLLEVTVMREMGVLITSIVVAGRSSSSFTAQIGAMVSNEEVAALRSMGLDPMELLVAPRVIALLITLPLLVFIANIMALAGGALAIWYSMDLSFMAFVDRFHSIAQVKNFFVGMVKSPFFAIIIGTVGCYQGLNASRSAESVGFLTTKSVVESIFLVIVLDAMFAIFFTTIGI